MQDARNVLQNIASRANSMLTMHSTHLGHSGWDWIPIVGTWVRSHKLAGKEAVAINSIKSSMVDLRAIVREHNLPLNLQKLEYAVSRLGAPGGVTKWLSTLTFFRPVHRGFTQHRNENVSLIANDLIEQMTSTSRRRRMINAEPSMS